jgi:hypothetical protein
VRAVLDRLTALFVERRIDPISLFPAGRGGAISKYSFERILTQTATVLTAEEVQAISSAFAVGAGEVNYEEFAAYFARARPVPEDISPVLGTIRSTLAAHKLQLRRELLKLSRNVTDDASRTHVIVALQNSSIVLGTAAIDGLVREFPGSIAGTVSITALGRRPRRASCPSPPRASSISPRGSAAPPTISASTSRMSSGASTGCGTAESPSRSFARWSVC